MLTPLSQPSDTIQGVGIGLRSPHINQIIDQQPDIPWLELLIDNHLVDGGLVVAQTEAICEQYPVTFHGVGLSIGSVDDLDFDYLNKIKTYIKRYQPAWYSEHIAFTSAKGIHSHDLLPLPHTEEAIKHIVDRISVVQDFLGQQILMENASSYLSYNSNEITEAEFVTEIVNRSDCHLLLDANNLYVNHINLNTNISDYLSTIPLERIKEIHLAGFEDKGDYLYDSHSRAVENPVWDIFTNLIEKIPGTATLIEWDNDIPELNTLIQEADKAQSIISDYSSEHNHVAV